MYKMHDDGPRSLGEYTVRRQHNIEVNVGGKLQLMLESPVPESGGFARS